MTYLYLKAFHIFFVVSWFAGLFYLPRLFVNLAMAEERAEYDRLLLMARKLYRFMTPLGVLALATGLGLWLGFGIAGGWLHAKLTLVAVLAGYHGYCGKLYRDFAARRNGKSHVWFRVFNELPVLVLLAVVILVVVKPF
ncbi:CopD family protein [Chromobacterium sp. IIBBL 290-4]|uniref:CopD family protein n=1 Tax=Chromobacterium sp. IIBBL 290-4 TaxID=2953890 RepID=UPI0020B83C5B|nr:CopD family protein [Chromobacterium sp. IIBBL 290-4]UTH75785.1 CopD family protein [Chromobacterium sp. IIBBL 290-4]